MTGLTTDTLYHVRAYATNSAGTSYGSEVTFTTLEAPSVTTQAVTSIAVTTATGNGNITDLGAPNPSAHGVCWSTSANPTVGGTCTNAGAASATGAFTGSMTGLTTGTLYHVRAYATNSVGTSYGSEVTFTTLEAPSVTTQAVTSIQSNSVICGGEVTDNGGAIISERGVCWATSPDPTTSDDCMVESMTGSGLGDFSTTISLLNSSSTYYVRAFATNSAGTAYGTTKTFKTDMFFYLKVIQVISQVIPEQE